MITQRRVIQSQQHNQDFVHEILLSNKDIRFGSVEVVIHAPKIFRGSNAKKSPSRLTGTTVSVTDL